MENQEEEYDPVLHLTGGELRSQGINIPENIPDCGWISRTAIEYKVKEGNTTIADINNGILDIGYELLFNEPFKWYQVDI